MAAVDELFKVGSPDAYGSDCISVACCRDVLLQPEGHATIAYFFALNWVPAMYDLPALPRQLVRSPSTRLSGCQRLASRPSQRHLVSNSGDRSLPTTLVVRSGPGKRHVVLKFQMVLVNAHKAVHGLHEVLAVRRMTGFH